MTSADHGLLRERGGAGSNKVTFVELFFDLVFVFAVTQLSHSLLEHFTTMGVVQTTLMLMAVWWVWIYTSWATNWLDPEKTAVRLMLFVLMLAGLVLSTSIPQAFESKGLAFAGAYVFMQVGRGLFTMWALRRASPGNYRNFQRIKAWLAFAAVFWIAGAFVEAEARLGLWAVALFIEYVSPSVGFWTPGLGRSTTADWDIEGSHMAERCGLFIIIALGESILVTGAKFGNLPWTADDVAAFAVSSSAAWRCGGSTSISAPRPPAGASPIRAIRADWRASPIPTCTCRWWRASSSQPSATSSFSPTRPATPTSRRRPCCWAARRSICSAICSSSGTTANRTGAFAYRGPGLLAGLVPVSLGMQPLTFSAAHDARAGAGGRLGDGVAAGAKAGEAVECRPAADVRQHAGALRGGAVMHTLMLVVGGLVALGIFVLAAVLLGRRVADGARVFIWPWLAASVVNMLIGIYWANIPFSVELPVLMVVFGVPAAVAWYVAKRFGA